MFATPSKPIEVDKRNSSYPRKVRLLRPSDFREVYEKGYRVSSPYFAAFCLAVEGGMGPKIGFTVTKGAGKSVVRNRVKRRMREAVRRNLWRLQPGWWVVVNPRRSALVAPFDELEREVGRLFLQCGKS